MDHLIDRYLDGELSEAEAAALEDLLRQQQDLDAELRSWEEVLAAVRRAEVAGPGPDFTDRVMNRIAVVGPIPRVRERRRAPQPVWALAATVVLAAGLGWFGAVLVGDAGVPGMSPGLLGTSSPADFPGARAALTDVGSLRLVRLVHVPTDGVQQVSVAGDFNGWDPAASPMTRQNGNWTASLLLPPGTYEYVFVEDGVTWVADPLALETRDDGFGQRNAVLDLTL